MKTIIAPFYRDWDDNVYKRLLKDFELPEKQRIKNLSKGMKMKFSLAIALSHHAELLLMDEPTSGLDPLIRSDLLEILADVIQDERRSVLFSTHITSDLDRIADYITLIHEGKILFSMGKDELLEHYTLIKGEKSLLGQELSSYLVGYRENQFGFEGLVTNKNELQPLLKGKAIWERPSLEEIMLYCTRRNVACCD
jgi:ABC-2 type transport system ATP-binding protein